MKKTALCILLLLALSGCSVRPSGDSGQPTDAPSAPTDGGVSRPSAAPTPTAGAAEESLPPAESSAPQVTPPPAAVDLGAYARQWCADNRDRFMGAEWYGADRALWFSAQAEGVYFYDGVSGAQTPAEAAQALHVQAADGGEHYTAIEPLDWAGMVERIVDETKGTGSKSALTARLEDLLGVYPALGEDMWLCGWAEEGDPYVMMRQGSVYRLQRSLAFEDYAASPEVQVIPAFERAAEAYGWFNLTGLPVDDGDVRQDEEGREFRRVEQNGISSMLELRTYLKDLFSDDIVDGLLAQGSYRDFDGVLYMSNLEGGGVRPQGPGSVERESPTRVVCRLATGDYVYELVGEKWIFTQFP